MAPCRLLRALLGRDSGWATVRSSRSTSTGKPPCSRTSTRVVIPTRLTLFFDLTPLPELVRIQEAVYWPNGKTLSYDYLKRLTPLSSAIWYQDDGHLAIRSKDPTSLGARASVEILPRRPSRNRVEHGWLSIYGTPGAWTPGSRRRAHSRLRHSSLGTRQRRSSWH